jgi:hypothetical protein
VLIAFATRSLSPNRNGVQHFRTRHLDQRMSGDQSFRVLRRGGAIGRHRLAIVATGELDRAAREMKQAVQCQLALRDAKERLHCDCDRPRRKAIAHSRSCSNVRGQHLEMRNVATTGDARALLETSVCSARFGTASRDTKADQRKRAQLFHAGHLGHVRSVCVNEELQELPRSSSARHRSDEHARRERP